MGTIWGHDTNPSAREETQHSKPMYKKTCGITFPLLWQWDTV